ncbi:MAG: tRNA threonylcarbamoyladenosine dehydratase [Lachnospiraceae bacterium]|nr:tRNA threonylcarbamoyladenosine dehydratase [Lachnospiraceae bacterium]
MDRFVRTEMLFGSAAMEKLHNAHVAVFGIGGVGGYVTEALARSGVGTFTLVDNDKVARSNINRQIIATNETVGRDKVSVMRERILAINPAAKVNTYTCFYLPGNASEFDFSQYSYVVDAIDTVTAKIDLVMQAKEAGVQIISCMGTGNKLDPTKLEIEDIYKTSVCPLAKVMRRELRKRDIKMLKVLYSKEEPRVPREDFLSQEERKGRRAIPGSTAFVPPAAGLIIAAEVVKDLAEMENRS